MDEKAYLLALAHAELPPRSFLDLLTRFGSAQAVWDGLPNDFDGQLVPKVKEKFLTFRKAFPLLETWAKFQRSKMTMLSITDMGYPKALKEIAVPPPVLFLRGSQSPGDEPGLAIVGSRNASAYGKLQARQWGASLAELGLTIVSGLARGIDMAAHQGALEAGGKTLAVLGSGIDRLYPPENENLAKRIELQGCLVSEFPPGTEPFPGNFPRRNRIISGLTLGVMVIEARQKSGALITAKFAVEQGREVFALPGLPGSEHSKGSNGLIQGGAKLVQEIGDVLEEFPYLSFKRKTGEPRKEDSLEAKILDTLQGQKEGKVVETLMKETKLPMEVLAGTLLVLETKGLVLRLPGNVYAKA